MSVLLIKTLGREFFAQHAGFFLFIFYMLFGAVEPGQLLYYHISILQAISSSPMAMGIFCALSLLYSVKTWLFVRGKLDLPTYAFIYASAGAEKRKQASMWLSAYAFMLSPILIYAGFVLATTIYYRQILTLGILLLTFSSLLAGLTWVSFRKINISFRPARTIHLAFLPVFRLPQWSWGFLHLLKKEPIMLFGCKILSFLVFKGILWVFADVDEKSMILFIALLGAVITHTILISTVQKFNRHYDFMKALPISWPKRLIQIVALFVFLFIPELWLFSSAVAFDPAMMAMGLLFCLGSVMSFYLAHYYFDDGDAYLKFGFGLFIVLFLSIIYLQTFAVGLVLLGLTVVYYRYLNTEFTV